MKYKTREDWLAAAVGLIGGLFKQQVPKVRVSCGWPSSRGVANKKYAIGECWPPKAAQDKVPQIFISPRIENADTTGVLPTLVHELIHAIDENKNGHKGPFRRMAKEVGLVGKMTATEAGPELMQKLAGMQRSLGEYPHSLLKPGFRLTKKQTTRLIKCECDACGYNVRVTRKWLDLGAPICPCNKKPMGFEIPDELEENED